jgi:hypothetical protein
VPKILGCCSAKLQILYGGFLLVRDYRYSYLFGSVCKCNVLSLIRTIMMVTLQCTWNALHRESAGSQRKIARMKCGFLVYSDNIT